MMHRSFFISPQVGLNILKCLAGNLAVICCSVPHALRIFNSWFLSSDMPPVLEVVYIVNYTLLCPNRVDRGEECVFCWHSVIHYLSDMGTARLESYHGRPPIHWWPLNLTITIKCVFIHGRGAAGDVTRPRRRGAYYLMWRHGCHKFCAGCIFKSGFCRASVVCTRRGARFVLCGCRARLADVFALSSAYHSLWNRVVSLYITWRNIRLIPVARCCLVSFLQRNTAIVCHKAADLPRVTKCAGRGR